MKQLFLAFLTLILLANCAENKNEIRPLIDYVPSQASLIIKINDHHAFINTLKNNDFLSELTATKAYQDVHEKISYLDYLQPKSESILAFTELSGDNFEFTYITQKTSNLFRLDSVKNTVKETVEFENSSIEKYTVDDATFYSLEIGDKIIISSSKLVLQQSDGIVTPIQSEILKKLNKTTNNAKPASFLINLDKCDALLQSKLNEKSELNLLGFSDWISLDLNGNESNLHLSGISIANDSTWNFIDLLANTKPATNNTPVFAPATSSAILSYTFDDYQAFSKNRALSGGVAAPTRPDLGAVEEIGIIYLNGRKNIVLNTFGAETIAEYLKEVRSSSIEFQGNEILVLKESDFLNTRFSPLVSNFEANYCTILANAFIFSKDQAALKVIIQNHKDANTFNKSEAYKAIEKEIAKESSTLFVANSKLIDQTLRDDFVADFTKDVKKGKLSNYAYAAQTISDKNFYHTNMVVQKIEGASKQNKITSLFEVKFPNDIATNPQLVTNHLNQKKEVVVQDDKNVLYLISSSGKILWKKQLESAIQGKIHQVDIFKNGRLQLAFTTNNQLKILDRNGKEVKQFSKTFEGGNLNPLAVFDYDKKKNYRFVVTQNDKIFMYDSKANIVKGFKFIQAEQPIIAAPKHLVVKNKDYLVFKLKDGTLKLLNRVGQIRTKVDKKIDFSQNEIFTYKNRFALTNKKGMFYEIATNGKVSKTSLQLSNDHGFYATERTLVTMNDNILSIKGKKAELEMGVYTQPEIFYINDKIYVSVTDLQNEKVYLFDSQANSISGFPIHGTSKIDLATLADNNTLQVVTKKDNKTLEAYKLN